MLGLELSIIFSVDYPTCRFFPLLLCCDTQEFLRLLLSVTLSDYLSLLSSSSLTFCSLHPHLKKYLFVQEPAFVP